MRAAFERHSVALASELSAVFRDELRTTETRAAENWNQAVRRLRQTSEDRDALALLADSTTSYCQRAAVFTIEGDSADCSRARGFKTPQLHLSVAEAAAFRSVMESKDPIVAAAAANEISRTLLDAMDGIGNEMAKDSVYLFPIVARQEVVAVLFAAGGVQAASLELLCEVVALRLEASPRPEPAIDNPQPLIQLEGAGKREAAVEPVLEAKRSAWEQLQPEDQALHLRAQRFARVKVAEFRLYRADAVRDGRARGELYRALHAEIDEARSIFYRDFIRASPTMVDYLHLELLRSLTHEDDRLLGPDYPGPLV